MVDRKAGILVARLALTCSAFCLSACAGTTSSETFGEPTTPPIEEAEETENTSPLQKVPDSIVELAEPIGEVRSADLEGLEGVLFVVDLDPFDQTFGSATAHLQRRGECASQVHL